MLEIGHLLFETPKVVECPQAFFQYGSPFVKIRYLFESSDFKVGFARDAAGIDLGNAGNDLQEGGLTGAIGAD